MSFQEKLLNKSNSYQYYKTNYHILKDHLDEMDKKIESLQNKVKILEKLGDSNLEYFNLIFIESNFKMKGQYRMLQLQTLELLKFLVNLCEKHGMTYWLDYGTLIGALRHEGFVPWDDEIDMSMPRADYEKFIKILEKEIASRPEFEGNVELRMGITPLRGVNYTGVPSPCAQFVQRKPLANVDIHPVDYMRQSDENENELAIEYTKNKFVKIRGRLREKLQSGEYEDFTQAALMEGEKIGFTFEETNFMGSCIDGTIRFPIPTSKIFPLKKCKFEDREFNIPRCPIEFLNSHYVGDIMKLPRYMVSHNRLDLIRKRASEDEDLNETFENVISQWKEINSEF